MARDSNYWKNKYSFLWKDSANRENMFKEIIEKETGLALEPYGIGAGTDKFITGSAKQNNSEKGAPDFHVVGTMIYLEVTGSFSSKTQKGDPLWFRRDKLNFAYANRFTHNEFLINHFASINEWFVIHLDDETFSYAISSKKNGNDFQYIKPKIRNAEEEYIEVKSDSSYVGDLSDLIEYLKSVKQCLIQASSEEEEIRTIRKSLGLSQTQFCEEFHIPLATLQDWEQKRRSPPTYIAYLIRTIIALKHNLS